MKSLPRLALGALFAGMLAVSTYATTQTCSTAAWNGPTGSMNQSWNVAVPSTVNITTSATISIYWNTGGGGSSISRNGVYVTGTSAVGPVGTWSSSNSAYGQPAGNYVVNQGCGGTPSSVYANIKTTFTW